MVPHSAGARRGGGVMLRYMTAVRRANSHLRYWRYRRKINNPVSLLSALREWKIRFFFELSNIKDQP
jgi:hypothetical protein